MYRRRGAIRARTQSDLRQPEAALVGDIVAEQAQLEGLLGIFQKLISSKVCVCVWGGLHEVHALYSRLLPTSLPLSLSSSRSLSLSLRSVDLYLVLSIHTQSRPPQTHDHEGLALLGALVEVLGLDRLQPYLPHVFSLCCARLSKSKTAKFERALLVFICLFVGRFGGEALVQTVDGFVFDMGLCCERARGWQP